jgi:DNA primase
MSVVDEVKARLDIVDVVSGYVHLQKAGRNFKALCPFHHEKTPSFVVFPETQTWRCFGACGEGGDLFSFVMKAEGWDFGEALRNLAKRAGVELTPLTSAQQQRASENERLQGLIEEAARFFHQQLLEAPTAQGARDYVAGRGLRPETITAFQVGYAPDDWQQALQHLQMLGYTQDEVVEAGLAIRNEQGHVYDRFRHRLMIPIRDGRGRTVGFGARALEKDAVPKYLNSPQGPLFDKGRLLYGLDMARRAIRETETAVIVEGYMDVMQAHQAGFANVVAQMGTALTEDQLRQLSRYARRLILALDPDVAGTTATMRGLNVARETLQTDGPVTFDPRGVMRYTGTLELDIRVITLPEGHDPDDLIRQDPAAWKTLLEHAIPVADYVIQQGTAHLTPQSSYQEREQAARALLPLLTATESDIERSGNIQALARRVRIDERTLLQWTQRRRAERMRSAPTVREQRRLAERPAPTVRAGTSPGHSALREGFCLRLLLEQPERLYAANRLLRELQDGEAWLGEVLAPLKPEDFTRPDYQAIFRVLAESLYQHDMEPLDYFYAHLSPELRAVVEELRVAPEEELEQALPRPLRAELRSIRREQARLNALPAADTRVWLQEVLALRQRFLEREWNELYFLQQDAQLLSGDLIGAGYHEALRANIRARQILARALSRVKTQSPSW